jgi:hypothetical protein
MPTEVQHAGSIALLALLVPTLDPTYAAIAGRASVVDGDRAKLR